MNISLRFLIPLISGMTAANMYYIQPLIPYASDALAVSYSSAALLYSLALVGNVLALAFIVPVADFIDRKKILLFLYTLSGISLVLFRFLTGYASLCVLSMLTGAGASALPVMIADISRRTRDKRIIGHIMGGILLGILSSRFIACLFCDLWGWTSVYLASGGLMFLATALLFAIYPCSPKTEAGRNIGYREILCLNLSLLVNNASVRYYSATGFLLMFLFAAFWNNMSGHLLAEFHLRPWETGVFSLTGMAGAAAAFCSDAILRHGKHCKVFLRLGCLLSVLVMASTDHSLWVLVAGTMLIDAFIQLIHASNQTSLYSSCPGSESRAASSYMTCFALGGAVGGYISSRLFSLAGWSGVLLLCLCVSASLLIVHLCGGHRPGIVNRGN